MVLLGLGAASLIPRPVIEEGIEVFLYEGDPSPYREALPEEVFTALDGAFKAAYPPEAQCPATADGCWRKQVSAPQQLYGFSAEQLWQGGALSRRVSMIDFSSRETLRLGLGNDPSRFNFFWHDDRNIDRRLLPLFVRYDLPDAETGSLSGSRLCWQGLMLWPQAEAPGRYGPIDHGAQTACRPLTAAEEGRTLYYAAIAPDAPVFLSLEPSLPWRLASLMRWGLALVGAALVLGLLLRRLPSPSRLLLPLGASFAALLTLAIFDATALTGLILHRGGADGMVLDHRARLIFSWALSGDWSAALQGGEPIYHHQPGLRYFLAIGKALFGESHYGYVIWLLLMPLALWRLLRLLLPQRWAATLMVLFLFVPIFERHGFAYYPHLYEITRGHAEFLGYSLFLAGLALLLSGLAEAWQPGRRPDAPEAPGQEAARASPPRGDLGGGTVLRADWAFLAGLVLALAVAVRTNVVPGAALLLSVSAWVLLCRGQWRPLLALCLGFAPVLLIPLHNWVYGGEFVPLTNTAMTRANLLASPGDYVGALREMLGGSLGGPHLDRVLHKLGNWNQPADFHRVLVFLVVLWIAFRRRTRPLLRLLAGIALMQQLVLFFYNAGGRYGSLAWLLSFLVFVTAWRETLLPALTRQAPRLVAWIGALPGLRHLGRFIHSPRWAAAAAVERRPDLASGPIWREAWRCLWRPSPKG